MQQQWQGKTKCEKLIVVKVGTETLLGDQGFLDQAIFDNIASQVNRTLQNNTSVIIVSSGAIKSGRERAEISGLSVAHLSKKDLAGIGQHRLMHRWAESFSRFGREVAQILVTDANWQRLKERQAIRSSVMNWLCSGVVSIVNANDVISDREIVRMEQGISENDELARLVAELVGATGVMFITHTGGVWSKDPTKYAKARLFKEVDYRTILKIGEKDRRASTNGSGGISAKLHAAVSCRRSGLRVAIAGQKDHEAIIRFARGEDVITMVNKKMILV